MAFLTLLNILIGAGASMPRLINIFYQGTAAAERIFEIFNLPTEESGSCKSESENGDRAIEFSKVTYGYSGKTKVLDNISFILPKGKVTTLVGDSGSGKSTIAKLLCGFYQPVEGKIMFLGKQQSDWNLEQYREQISFVPQNMYLFPGTILQNISYGNPNSTIDDIINAAKLANIHDFIVKLPEAYNTVIGENGTNLSGGEKQRIAIARALLKKTQVLIFDEPTSALDFESEIQICKTIKNISKNCIVLVISHRPTLISIADLVLVLDSGQIVESGSFQGLKERKGLFNKLYHNQVFN